MTRLTIQSTALTDQLDGVRCRRWEGEDEAGRRYLVFVHRIALLDDPAAPDGLEPVGEPAHWHTENLAP